MSNPYFVYGTLMPGGRYWPQIGARVASHTRASVDGFDLFSLRAGYPAIVPGDGRVHGALLTFRPESEAEAIATMNRIEGWNPNSATPLYRPAEVEAETANGRIWAITYVWGTGSRTDLESRGEYLPGGDWTAGGAG